MNRRAFLASILVAPTALAADKPASKKKGWAGGDSALREKFRANWWYDWTPHKSGADYVPMVKGAWNLKGEEPARVTKALQQGGALLGFNEPERKDQGNLSVADAVKLWPQLVELAKAKGCRIGSPAPSSDGAGMRWLAEFMKEAKREKLQVDFVALHWYRSRDVAAFSRWLGEMHGAYRLPLWITEFNGWAGTERENEVFLRGALKALERDRDVERYAYFSPRAGHVCALLKADGSLSKLGEMYQEV